MSQINTVFVGKQIGNISNIQLHYDCFGILHSSKNVVIQYIFFTRTKIHIGHVYTWYLKKYSKSNYYIRVFTLLYW